MHSKLERMDEQSVANMLPSEFYEQEEWIVCNRNSVASV